jgi:probable rRNA maturation factor
LLTTELEIEITVSEEDKEAINMIGKVLAKTADLEKLPPVSVAVIIVDSERIQEINRLHRQIDMPTDVLSFPLFEDRAHWVKEEWEEVVELGDIIISLPRAHEQAKSYGHSLLREISFLAVHGFLHLIGYGHETETEEQKMFSLQDDVLAQLGITR